MYNECNCGNSQSLEIRGPSRRHHPEETSETASPRFIPSILCSELHREPQFPVPVELLILEMDEMPLQLHEPLQRQGRSYQYLILQMD